MTPDELNAWIRLKIEAELLCARIELEGMLAENQQRAYSGLAPAYTEEAFLKLLSSHGIQCNDVQSKFQECY
jgi:hypothetical protein